MKLQRIIGSAICATQDRIYITRATHRKLENIESGYVNKLIEESGPSVHGIKAIAKNWKRAYKHNYDRLTLIHSLNAPFQTPNTFVRIFNRLTHK